MQDRGQQKKPIPNCGNSRGGRHSERDACPGGGPSRFGCVCLYMYLGCPLCRFRGAPVDFFSQGKLLIHHAQSIPTYTTRTVTCPPSRACRPRARYPLLDLRQAGLIRPAHPISHRKIARNNFRGVCTLLEAVAVAVAQSEYNLRIIVLDHAAAPSCVHLSPAPGVAH